MQPTLDAEAPGAQQYADYLIDSFTCVEKKSIRCPCDGFLAVFWIRQLSWAIVRQVKKNERLVLDMRSAVILVPSEEEAEVIAEKMSSPFSFRMTTEGTFCGEHLPIITYWPERKSWKLKHQMARNDFAREASKEERKARLEEIRAMADRQMPYNEISKITGVPMGTLEDWRHRGLIGLLT